MGKSTRARGGARARQSAQTGAWEVLLHPQRSTLGSVVGWLVRARAELFLVGCVVATYIGLSAWLAPWGVYTTVGVVFVLIIAVAPIRRYVIRRYWCVFTRHRARACFRSTWTMTYDGTLPYLLWARPTPVGERVRVWLPAGLSVHELDRVCDKLATACWARHARIEEDRRFASSAVLHIVRRDPLDSDRDTTPDLLDGITVPEQDRGSTPLPTRDAVAQAAGVQHHAKQGSTNGHDGPTAGRASKAVTSTAAQQASEPEPEIRGFGGMDVSDYV